MNDPREPEAGGTLRLASSLTAVDEAAAFTANFCRREHVGGDTEHALVLILEELITNTVTHGRPPPASSIVVDLNRDGDHVLLDYLDHGIAFDPLSDLPEPDFSATITRAPVGGVGWPLILHFSASAEYRREGDANVLHLAIPVVG